MTTEAAAAGVPVVTLDGPSGSGKGTVALLLARHLGWHLLDSGALYRLVGYHAGRLGIALDDEPALARIAQSLPAEFVGPLLPTLSGDAVW